MVHLRKTNTVGGVYSNTARKTEMPLRFCLSVCAVTSNIKTTDASLNSGTIRMGGRRRVQKRWRRRVGCWQLEEEESSSTVMGVCRHHRVGIRESSNGQNAHQSNKARALGGNPEDTLQLKRHDGDTMT